MIYFISKYFPRLYIILYFNYKHITDQKKIKIIKSYIKNKTIIIDIGANIGFYTILFSKYSKNSTILAFEPDKNNFNLLKKI